MIRFTEMRRFTEERRCTEERRTYPTRTNEASEGTPSRSTNSM